MSFITPNRYCAATSATALRKIILSSTAHGEIVSTSKLGVFEDAANYPVISVLVLGEPTGFLCVREALAMDRRSESTSRSYSISLSEISSLPCSIVPINVSHEQIALRLKVRKAFPTLGTCFSFSEGLRIPSAYESEQQDDFLILKQYQFERWTPLRKGTWIKAAHLKKVVGVKSARFEKIVRDKIVVAEDALEITATIDRQKAVPQGGVYFGVPTRRGVDLVFVLGLLNSQLLSALYQILFGGMHMGGGFLRFRTSFLEELPVPDVRSSDQKSIAGFVSRILAAKAADPSADVSAWEREIDEIVYRLYGLAAEEIRIVEGGGK